MPGPLVAFRPLAVLALVLLSAPVAFAAGAEPGAAGDIPDTQAFVRYSAPAGYSLLVPEGWSRTVRGNTVTFSSHFDGVQVSLLPRSSPGAALRAIAPHAVAPTTSTVRIDGAPVVRLTFSSDSQPDPVTGKRVRLDDEAYVFVRGSRTALLHLWAPHGADNADQWLKIAHGFR